MLLAILSFLVQVTAFLNAMGIRSMSHTETFVVSPDHALIGHVAETIQSVDRFKCALFCMSRHECLSANFHLKEKSCDLNRKRREDYDWDFIEYEGCSYLEIQEACKSNPCFINGTCRLDYEPNMPCNYRCLSGYKGAHCEKVIDGYSEDKPALSCKEIYDQEPSSPSGVYYFRNVTGSSSTPYKAFCFMGIIDGCGQGGWSLAMKIDGTKTTFHYNSTFWENQESYNPSAGTTGFDVKETKMPFYWSMPVTKLCLGMRVGQTARWIKLEYSAPSLYDVISSNTFRLVRTSVQWRYLVDGSSLQGGFKLQGFNAQSTSSQRVWINSRARIGVVGNNEADGFTPDSRIGFGTGGSGRNEDDKNSCGNEAASDIGADNGRVSIKAFCYILLQ